MANMNYQDGSREPTRKESPNADINDKIIIGGFVLVAMALTAILYYAASIGIYIDPAAFN